MKGLGAISTAGFLGGSTEKLSEKQYVENEIDRVMAEVEDSKSQTGLSGRDKTMVYLGNPNDYEFRGHDGEYLDTPLIRSIVEEKECDISLVYLDEEIDEEEFQKRRRAEYRNYVENLDTFFGLDEREQHYLLAAAESLEAATYPEKEFRDKIAYIASRVADKAERYSEDAAGVLRSFSEEIYHDPEEYRVPDESLEEVAAYVENQYEDVLNEFDVDVTVDVQRITTEQLEAKDYRISDITPPSRHRKLGKNMESFRQDFGYEDGTLPIIMSTRDMGPGFDGSGRKEAAFIHVPVDALVHQGSLEEWTMGRMLKWYLVPHEAGHSTLRFPHNSYPQDVMSYNKVPRTMTWAEGNELEIGEWDRALVDRLITGEDLDPEYAADLTVDHLSVYLETLMDFEAIQSVDEKEYVQDENMVRYTWDHPSAYSTELDVTLSNFIEDINTRTFKDGELIEG